MCYLRRVHPWYVCGWKVVFHNLLSTAQCPAGNLIFEYSGARCFGVISVLRAVQPHAPSPQTSREASLRSATTCQLLGTDGYPIKAHNKEARGGRRENLTLGTWIVGSGAGRAFVPCRLSCLLRGLEFVPSAAVFGAIVSAGTREQGVRLPDVPVRRRGGQEFGHPHPSRWLTFWHRRAAV